MWQVQEEHGSLSWCCKLSPFEPLNRCIQVDRMGVKDYLEKGIQTPMVQGRSTQIISMIKWIRTSRLSIKNSLYGLEGLRCRAVVQVEALPQSGSMTVLRLTCWGCGANPSTLERRRTRSRQIGESR